MASWLTILAGLASLGFGAWAVWATWPLLWLAVKAAVPALCIVGGALAVLVGIAELRDRCSSRKPPHAPPPEPPAGQSPPRSPSP